MVAEETVLAHAYASQLTNQVAHESRADIDADLSVFARFFAFQTESQQAAVGTVWYALTRTTTTTKRQQAADAAE